MQPNKHLLMAGTLALFSLFALSRGCAPEPVEVPERVNTSSARIPMPSQYPGGATNPEYQRASREFERAMAAEIDNISARSDAASENLMGEASASIWRIVGLAGVAMALLLGVQSQRKKTD